MTRRRQFPLMIALIAFASACGGDYGPQSQPKPTPPPDPTNTGTNHKPEVAIASSGALAIGEQFTVLGNNFLEPRYGKVFLRFQGAYFPDGGGSLPVDFQAPATVLKGTQLTWALYPHVVFDSQKGDRLGKFVGRVLVANMGKDGTQQMSDPQEVTITVKPSLIPRLAQPMQAGCSTVVSHTLEKQPMQFSVEALGFRPASANAPLTFRWNFMAEQWDVKWGSFGSMDPNSIIPKQGGLVIEDRITSGLTSGIGDGSKSYLLKVADDVMGSGGLKELRTKTLQTGENNISTTVNVAVSDTTGKTAVLAIPITYHREADMIYDGNTRDGERLAPVMVTDCMPGGDIGREVNYHESTSESRARTLGFNWNGSASGSAAPTALVGKPFLLNINYNAGFGVNVNQHVSSDKSKSLSVSGQILPGEYGAFYRQTTKVYRIGQLVGYTACGQTYPLGDAILTDWLFSPDLATGTSCPPPSGLPPAKKFLNLDAD